MSKKYKITPSSLRRHVDELEARDFSKSIPERSRASQTDMNSASIGSFPLAPGPAPLPWLYVVNLTQIEPRKQIKKFHWLRRFG